MPHHSQGKRLRADNLWADGAPAAWRPRPPDIQATLTSGPVGVLVLGAPTYGPDATEIERTFGKLNRKFQGGGGSGEGESVSFTTR